LSKLGISGSFYAFIPGLCISKSSYHYVLMLGLYFQKDISVMVFSNVMIHSVTVVMVMEFSTRMMSHGNQKWQMYGGMEWRMCTEEYIIVWSILWYLIPTSKCSNMTWMDGQWDIYSKYSSQMWRTLVGSIIKEQLNF
jgi:hypothetical protein